MAFTDRLGPLSERDFRNLYVGQAVSVIGDGLLLPAVAFAVLEIGGGPGEIGLALGANAIALVVFALIGGVWADRLPRHRVMLAADAIRCVVQALGAALLLTGRAEVWHLVVLLTVYGAAEAFFRPAATGLVPHTVKPAHLQQANALLGLTQNAGMVVGPVIGGILVAVVGAGGAFAFDAGTFVVSAFFLLRVRGAAAAVPRGERRAFSSELAEGLREVRRQSWLWWTILVASLWLLLTLAPVLVLGPVVADRELSGATSWAIIIGAYGVGGVLGGLWALRFRPGRPLLVASFLFGLEALLPAFLAVVPPIGLIAGAAVLGGISAGVFEAVWATALQQRVPDATLARVSALDWMGSLALLPLGYVLAGPMAELIGTDAVLWAAAAAGVACSAALVLHPGVRGVRRGVPPLDLGDATRV